MARRFRPSRLFLLLLGLAACASAADDHRASQHGIDLLRVEGKLLAVWGSAGDPPRPSPGGDWQHDIYYAWIGASAGAVEPRILVSLPEAQEPPSTAINAKGTILVTSEDGNGGINQNAGLWDSAMRVRRKYPFVIRRGGHSGHAAAMGERFLVAYGEGWVKGGGWNGLGTGENVFARIVEDDGGLGREAKLTPGRLPNPRDGWPLVAGSDRNWLVVWQRYPGMTLQSALIDATGNVARRGQIIGGLPLRYAYGVEYSPALSAYVVAGTSAGKGFVALIGVTGELLRIQTGLPAMASESRIVLGRDGAQLIAAYPVDPRGIALLHLSARDIALIKVVDHPHEWDYAGTAGIFVAPGQALFATLTTAGMKLISILLQP
jgi:hypothetical protein